MMPARPPPELELKSFPHTILKNRSLVGERQRPAHILVVDKHRVQSGDVARRKQGSLGRLDTVAGRCGPEG